MVKSESEVRVFLLADFLRDGAEETILVKEVVWREGLCSPFQKKGKNGKKRNIEKKEKKERVSIVIARVISLKFLDT